MIGDTIGLATEELRGEALLRRVMKDGELVDRLPSLEEVQAYASEQVSQLPEMVHSLTSPASYPVSYSDRLEAARGTLQRELAEHYRGKSSVKGKE